jgi:hypothetical protein
MCPDVWEMGLERHDYGEVHCRFRLAPAKSGQRFIRRGAPQCATVACAATRSNVAETRQRYRRQRQTRQRYRGKQARRRSATRSTSSSPAKNFPHSFLPSKSFPPVLPSTPPRCLSTPYSCCRSPLPASLSPSGSSSLCHCSPRDPPTAPLLPMPPSSEVKMILPANQT